MGGLGAAWGGGGGERRPTVRVAEGSGSRGEISDGEKRRARAKTHAARSRVRSAREGAARYQFISSGPRRGGSRARVGAVGSGIATYLARQSHQLGSLTSPVVRPDLRLDDPTATRAPARAARASRPRGLTQHRTSFKSGGGRAGARVGSRRVQRRRGRRGRRHRARITLKDASAKSKGERARPGSARIGSDGARLLNRLRGAFAKGTGCSGHGGQRRKKSGKRRVKKPSVRFFQRSDDRSKKCFQRKRLKPVRALDRRA